MNSFNNRQRGHQNDADTKFGAPPTCHPSDDPTLLGSPFILRHEQESASDGSRHGPSVQPNYTFYEHQQHGSDQYVPRRHSPHQQIEPQIWASDRFPDPERTVRQVPRSRNVSGSKAHMVESTRSGSIPGPGRVKHVAIHGAGTFFSPTPPDSPEAALRRPQLLSPPPNGVDDGEQYQYFYNDQSSSAAEQPRNSSARSRHQTREDVIPEVPSQKSLLTPPSSPENSISVNAHIQSYSTNATYQTPRILQNTTYEIANTYHASQPHTRHHHTQGSSQSESLSSRTSSLVAYRRHNQLLSSGDSTEFSIYAAHWNAEEESLLLMPNGPGSVDASLETTFAYPIGSAELMNESSLLLLPIGPASADVSLDSFEYYTPEQLEHFQAEQLPDIERVEYAVHAGEDDEVTVYWSSPQNLDPQTSDIGKVDKGKSVDTSQVSQRMCSRVLSLRFWVFEDGRRYSCRRGQRVL